MQFHSSISIHSPNESSKKFSVMKCLVLLFLLFSCQVQYLFAQYESRKAYAGFSIGPSLASGDFASNLITKETSGFARDGVMLNLNFAYRIASNFGVTAMILVQVNPFDDQALLDGLVKNYNHPGNPQVYTAVDADAWGLSGINAGGFASIPLGSNGKMILEPRAMVSLLTAISPRIKISARSGNASGYVEQQTGAGAAFGFSIGGGFRFNLSDRTALLLNADYLKTKPKFIDVEYRYSDGTVDYDSFEQKIEAVNIGIGFAIRFKKDVPPVRRGFSK